MKEKIYPHKARVWRLFIYPEHLMLQGSDFKVSLPLFGIGPFFQTESQGRVRQLCEGSDGWSIQVDYTPQQEHFALSISQYALRLDFPDAPANLCLDLLELLAARSAFPLET